jgi:NhaA family Na+:H+ antiporter
MSNALEPSDLLPREPIQTLIDPIRRFLHIEAMSGVLLVAATLAALIAANSSMGESFLAFWQTPVGLGFGAVKLELSLLHWINDFLMPSGYRMEWREWSGELRDMRRAAPFAAAVGGMIAQRYISCPAVSGVRLNIHGHGHCSSWAAWRCWAAHPGQPEDHAAVAGHRR